MKYWAFAVFSMLLIQSIAGASITLDPAKISATEETNPLSKLQTNDCKCNVNSGMCDDSCCCDPDCSPLVVAKWRLFGNCIDRIFMVSPSKIRSCSEKNTLSLADLQKATRIYYHIIRALFCVSIDNSDAKDRYKPEKTTEELDKAVAISESSAVKTSFKTYVEKQDGTLWKKFTIPRTGFSSATCKESPIIFYNNQELDTCYKSGADITALCVSGDIFDPDYYDNIVLKGNSDGSTVTLTRRNIYLRDPKVVTGYSPSTAALSAISNTGCECANFVSEVHYYIESDALNEITAAYYDVVVTSSQTFANCNDPLAFSLKTSLHFVSSPPPYITLTGPGYKLGDPVIFGIEKENTTSGVSAIEAYWTPLSFNYFNGVGRCSAKNTEHQNDAQDVKFGINYVFSCSEELDLASLETYCSGGNPGLTQMYENVITNIKYAAIYPNANPLYISDWVKIENSITALATPTWSSVLQQCTISFPRINIYYSLMGRKEDADYRINSVSVETVDQVWKFTKTDPAATQIFNLRLYVNFIQLPQEAEFFVAPAPKVKVTLPDNVLYPFELPNT